MKLVFIFLICFLSSNAIFGQNLIDWDKDYKLQKTDFEASKNDGMGDLYSVNAAIAIGFGFNMTGYEFMFSRNFNSKVSTTFARKPSYIIAPDTITLNQFLNLAQVEFDLAELHARKFRKMMYESKKPFSDTDFYEKLYEDMQAEFSARNSKLIQDTNMGQAELRLKESHEQIMKEIEDMADFCKQCKPQKRKTSSR